MLEFIATSLAAIPPTVLWTMITVVWVVLVFAAYELGRGHGKKNAEHFYDCYIAHLTKKNRADFDFMQSQMQNTQMLIARYGQEAEQRAEHFANSEKMFINGRFDILGGYVADLRQIIENGMNATRGRSEMITAAFESVNQAAVRTERAVVLAMPEIYEQVKTLHVDRIAFFTLQQEMQKLRALMPATVTKTIKRVSKKGK